MNYLVLNDGSQIPATVFCFGCNKTHDVEAYMEVGSRNSEETQEEPQNEWFKHRHRQHLNNHIIIHDIL